MPEAKARKSTRSSGTRAKSAVKQGSGKRALMERPRQRTPEQRHRMIAERAYLNAARRGFEGDHCLDDWLEAERAIDREPPS